ncbi:hypothetical protein CTAYLR_008724 [Chrysophaeum taylorii]|uniref:Protein kinase domain-containing protein n=1 Tax=Chrysophaeum taylorii TaxID=2483200 RepID=A0AAD7XL71_9STRA|nr:hypothetical protein CTAYLR_008724 [Chrysophaeum taylorii]
MASPSTPPKTPRRYASSPPASPWTCVVCKRVNKGRLACLVCGTERTYRLAAQLDGLKFESFEDLEMLEVTGTGSFGAVHLALSRSSQAAFAVKAVQIKDDNLEELCGECSLLRNLEHPRIVKFFDSRETPDAFYIVTEFLAGGDLFSRLEKRGKYPEDRAKIAALAVLDALAYLHARSIAHRDVKPENILLKSRRDDCDLKLCDFGLATYATRRLCDWDRATPEYAAPEILEKREYGCEVDMWAFGVVVVVLLTGHLPSQNDDDLSSRTAATFVRGLLERDQDKRMTASRAQRHAWFLNGGKNTPDPPTKDLTPSSLSIRKWLLHHDLPDLDLRAWCDTLDDLLELEEDDALCTEFLAEAGLTNSRRFRAALHDLPSYLSHIPPSRCAPTPAMV